MSKFQKRVRDLLQELLGVVTIKEEVNVKKLFPEYPSYREHYDLVIPAFDLIVECHGEQHRSIQSFGEKDLHKVVTNLAKQKHRDTRKEEFALDNGWNYLAVWHDELSPDDEEALVALKVKILIGLHALDKG